MDIIILGLLMIKNSTIYEMHKSIETWLFNVSSNSFGSIQAAIKKLTAKEMIGFSEHVENSVNKKVYAITPKGREYFLSSVSSPMRNKEKNMELSKFFFMGFADQRIWVELIDAYIAELQKELDELEQNKNKLVPEDGMDQAFIESQRGKGVTDEITNERIKNIALFQYATLELGIEQLKFQIGWYENFKQTLAEGAE